MTNILEDALEDESYPMGTWLSIGHPTVAEVSASSDVEFVLIDTEHTTMSLETVENMTRAVDAADSPTDTIIRVPWNDPIRLKRTLDIGINGVMVPMIDTADEARALVNAMRYPPDGIRGVASGRATEYGENFAEYVANANGSFTTIAQIESKEGLENAEAIARVDGIDALFVGPADLSAALGVFGQENPEKLVDAMEHVIEVGANADVAVGTLVDPADVENRIKYGFDFLIVGKDTSTLATANREARTVYEDAIARHSNDESPSEQ